MKLTDSPMLTHLRRLQSQKITASDSWDNSLTTHNISTAFNQPTHVMQADQEVHSIANEETSDTPTQPFTASVDDFHEQETNNLNPTTEAVNTSTNNPDQTVDINGLLDDWINN